jgi:surfactin synthase thioesterase subunit
MTGDRDPYATVAEVAAWQEHSSASFDLRLFGGGHFFIDPYRQEVIDIISGTLDEVLTPTFANRS